MFSYALFSVLNEIGMVICFAMYEVQCLAVFVISVILVLVIDIIIVGAIATGAAVEKKLDPLLLVPVHLTAQRSVVR